MSVVIHHGDSRDVLKTLADASVDSVVCDPPYALVSVVQRFGNSPRSETTENVENPYGRTGRGFMGQKWDTGETAFAVTFWTEVYRVLKPGGHVVAFSGTRTYHRLACAVEDAGFEIRDMLSWLYGSGFPKSHDVSKGIDKAGPPDQAPFAEFAAHYEERRKDRGLTHAKVCAAGGWHGEVNHGGSSVNWANGYGMPTIEQWAILQPLLGLDERWAERVRRVQYEREVVGRGYRVRRESTVQIAGNSDGVYALTSGGSEASRQWEGWGTALKPACEPIVFARKPLGTCGVNVVDVVEFGLRNQGVEGEIRWTSEPASGAAKSVSRRTSSSTVQPPAGETSAAPVGGSETGNGERPTARSSALTGGSGATPTLDEAGSTAEPLTPSSAPKSSPHTAVTANVAESKNKPSSPSITSTAAEPNTGGASTAKSTPSCDASDSPATDTGCFAGIATGLTGSLAHVHISRSLDGSFVWPKGLPKRLDPQPLTVAANVLAHGTGALNIDGCRVVGESTLRLKEGGAGQFPHEDDAWKPKTVMVGSDQGRWPANVLHDGSDEVVGAFPETSSGSLTAAQQVNGGWAGTLNVYGTGKTGGTNEYAGDTGSAARFFYAAKPDDLCGLCGCPSGVFSGKPSPCNANTAEPSSPTENTQSAATAPCDAVGSQLPVREVKNQASSGLATDAELPSSRHRQAGSDTAAGPAATPGLSSLAQNVKSAGNLCGSCATAIAQSLAATRLGQNPELQPSPVSISERSAQILRQHLALYVEGRESTDTILTTPSLRQLLGSVFHAIAESTLTTEEKPSASSEKSKRLWYGSKADATDRLGSKHPTVKPTDLMRWLVRLVTPPGGVVLDPFAGSGSTGVACVAEGFDAILIEREAEYVADIRRRIAWAQGEGRLTAQEMAKKPDLGLEGLSLFE